MKRSVLAVILILSALFCVFGQSSSPIDLILLLDTSSGMASSYETVSSYLTGHFLSEFLRVGDTFHLITYSGYPRLDAARRIESRGDIETIIGRMLIQYPVESGNDVTAAISYAEDYASSLPSRPKKIVMVGTGSPDINSLISAARQRLSLRNTSLDFVLAAGGQPLASLPSSGRSSAVAAASSAQRPAAATPATQAPAQTAQTPSSTTPAQTPPQAAPSPAPEQTTTTTPAQTSPTPSMAAPQTSSSTEPQTTPSQTPADAAAQTPSSPDTQTATQAAGTSGASGESVSSPPAEASTGSPSSQAGETAGTSGVQSQGTPTAREAQGANNQAAASTPRSETTSASIFSSSLPLIIGIIVLVLLILGLIIFFASRRRLGSSPDRVTTSVPASKQGKQEKETAANQNRDYSSYAAGQNKQRTTPYADRPVKTENAASPVINPQGPLLLNLFVEDQNTAIGKRNIHSLKSGYSLTVGGGKSDFLIFLVPVPPHIGEIHRNGSQCTFIPRKPKYFPDLGSNELRDCINKTIRVISDKEYELRFRFEMYEDPLEALNKILHSVNASG